MNSGDIKLLPTDLDGTKASTRSESKEQRLRRDRKKEIDFIVNLELQSVWYIAPVEDCQVRKGRFSLA